MERRLFLRVTTKILLVAGLCTLGVALVQSLLPSPQVDASLPHFDLSSLGPGQATSFEPSESTPLSRRWLVLRLPGGEVRVFTVPTRQGLVMLPNRYWWRPGTPCRDFGPDLVDGRFAADAIIHCRDVGLPDAIAKKNRWDLDGKNLGFETDDMMRTRHQLHEGTLVIG